PSSWMSSVSAIAAMGCSSAASDISASFIPATLAMSQRLRKLRGQVLGTFSGGSLAGAVRRQMIHPTSKMTNTIVIIIVGNGHRLYAIPIAVIDTEPIVV